MGLDVSIIRKDQPDEDLFYWRRCWFVVYWFLEHKKEKMSDSGELKISKDDIDTYINTCRRVLQRPAYLRRKFSDVDGISKQDMLEILQRDISTYESVNLDKDAEYTLIYSY